MMLSLSSVLIPSSRQRRSRFWLVSLCLLWMLFLLACQPQNKAEPVGLSLTQQALQTQISAVDEQALNSSRLTQTALSQFQQTQDAQRTLIAQPVPDIPSQNTPEIAPTSTPEIGESVSSSLPPSLLSAKILVYESMSGQRIYGIYPIRYIREALDYAKITYVDVGSAQGWFLDKLRSDEKWDLIIASSEANSTIQGEFAELLYERLQQGSAMILEIWDLNRVRSGKIAPILALCGVGYYADLKDVSRLAMYPLDREHPIFNTPNQNINLQNISPFWQEDNGDLLKITGEGDARLLAGTNPSQTTDHGTIAECLQGRMIIQTFRSHDLALLDSEALWQNYVYYVLR
ncbi:MAG: hypothetical protein ACOY16_13715 [Chloroflexota bacterium]